MNKVRVIPKVLALSILVLLGASAAQERPQVEDLEGAFIHHVPIGWFVADFIIEAAENYGTEVEPDIRTRFRAVVEAEADTFEATGTLGGATLLRPVLQAGERRTFFGIARSVRRLGSWETQFDLENDPTVDTGFALDYFSGRRLILGSEEEATFRNQLETEAQEELEASLAQARRDEQLREQERAEDLAEAAHEIALEAKRAEAREEAELARVRQEASQAAALREQAAAERAARRTELDELLDELPQQLAAELRLQFDSYWSVGEVDLIEAVLQNSFDEPVFRLTFKAVLTLDEDTFAPRRTEDDLLLLDPLREAGYAHDLRGGALAQWTDGIWSIDFAFENLEGVGDGAPRAHFPPHALVAGSSEEAAFREALELRLNEVQQRELAEIKRKQELQTAEHEAQRTAAAEKAQLEAMEVAARAAQYRALEASILGEGDRAAKMAALESALLTGDDLILGMAIPIALVSGNSHLVGLALEKALLGGAGIQLSRSEPSAAIWLNNIQLQDDGVVVAEMKGTVDATYGPDREQLNCGTVSGRLESGELSLSNDVCSVQLYAAGTDRLEARVFSKRTNWWTLGSPFPGSRAAE